MSPWLEYSLYAVGAVYCAAALVRFYADWMAGVFP